MGGFCSGIADITLCVKSLCNLHSMLWTHSWNRMKKSEMHARFLQKVNFFFPGFLDLQMTANKREFLGFSTNLTSALTLLVNITKIKAILFLIYYSFWFNTEMLLVGLMLLLNTFSNVFVIGNIFKWGSLVFSYLIKTNKVYTSVYSHSVEQRQTFFLHTQCRTCHTQHFHSV